MALLYLAIGCAIMASIFARIYSLVLIWERERIEAIYRTFPFKSVAGKIEMITYIRAMRSVSYSIRNMCLMFMGFALLSFFLYLAT